MRAVACPPSQARRRWGGRRAKSAPLPTLRVLRAVYELSPRKSGERSRTPSPCIHRDRQQRALRDRGGERGLLAHIERRGCELIDDRGEPRGGKIAQRGFDIRFAREMQSWKSTLHHGRRRRTLGHGE